MHSALKHEGKPLYDYARAGIEVERAAAPRPHRRDPRRRGQGDRWTIDVACSKGTYVRTLGRGHRRGARLRRAPGRAAPHRERRARPARARSASTDLEALDATPPRRAACCRADALVAGWPEVVLASEDAGRFLAGVRRRLDLADAPHVRVYGPEPGAFLGTGHIAGGELIASRLLSPAEVAALVAQRRPCPSPESLSA